MGTSLRSDIDVDHPQLIDGTTDAAAALSGLPVLRLYWEDSARHGVPDPRQERIGELSKVKHPLSSDLSRDSSESWFPRTD